MNKEEIKKLIESGFTNKQLSDKYNCSQSTIRRFLKKNSIQRKVLNLNPIKNNFKSIDTKEKAYWLGFLFADGCVIFDKENRVYRLSLDLGEKDLESVERFCDFMGIDRKNISTLIRKQKHVSKRININSKEICEDLINLGCVPRKTLSLPFINLSNKQLDLAFLLGYYDGDGEENSCVVTCGNRNFLQGIINKHKIKFEIKIYGNNTFKLNLGSTLVKAMLDNHSNSMPRKRKTYSKKNLT